MNVFLQRMLRRSDEELNTEVADKEAENNDESKSSSTRGSWIKKLGNYSPSKYKVPSSPLKTSRMKDLDSSLSSTLEATTPRKIPGTSGSPIEMPDLESIIREFEMGFLSPTKHVVVATDATKQRNFVKKIVAAFEVKYKAYNDSKSEEESKECEEDKLERGRSRLSSMETPRRRSGLFGSPRKNKDLKGACAESPSRNTPDSSSKKEQRSGIFSSPKKSQDSKTPEKKSACNRSPSESTPDESSKQERRSGIFSSPKKKQDEDSKSSRRSGIFTSPFAVGRSTSKDPNRRSGIYMSPVNPDGRDSKNSDTSSDSSTDNASLFKFDKEESICGNPISSSFLNPFRTISMDDNKSVSSIDLDVTLPEPEETILIDDVLEDLTTDDFSMSRCETPEMTNILDKTPKIVGAFLKTPIEVENTSIDWIPITGKKLPRKKSLKKLLSVLTGKKSFEKKSSSVLFSSERNLSEESRELQDSGYDEKSCSSSSLTSLVSITEVLLHQENSYVEPERRSTLRTFRSRNSLDREDEEEDEAFCDAYPTIRRGKRLVLTEVPREELKLDLGPTYPSSTKILTMSLDRRAMSKQKTRTPSPKYVSMTRIPKHPFLSKIKKHPFVSMTKMDEYLEPNESLEMPMIIQNGLYKVEFRRSCEELIGSRSSRGSTSDESNYDVPRRFLSKSETSIPGACNVSMKNIEDEHVYDIPKSKFMARPRSSVYEDALSLKRRTAQLPSISPPDFYAFANDSEPHYATVKPRNRKAFLSEEMLRSNGDPGDMKKSSSF